MTHPETTEVLKALAEGSRDYTMTPRASVDLAERQQAAAAVLQEALGDSVRVSGHGYPNIGDQLLDLIYVKMRVGQVDEFLALLKGAPELDGHRHVFKFRVQDIMGKWVFGPSDGSVHRTLICDCGVTQRESERRR